MTEVKLCSRGDGGGGGQSWGLVGGGNSTLQVGLRAGWLGEGAHQFRLCVCDFCLCLCVLCVSLQNSEVHKKMLSVFVCEVKDS